MNYAGRYQIGEELGRGTMGVVYRAFDPPVGRTVAVKVIRLDDFANTGKREEIREQLILEAQSAGVLSHPNIVAVYDVLGEAEFVYIVMELVNGYSLDKLKYQPSMFEKEALPRFLRQAADALDYAHHKGILHRDIKPSNILISDAEPGFERSVKITDFGMAKFIFQAIAQGGSMSGTPDYMSPEQIQGVSLDGRSDQFSFAVVVYELVTGKKPFIAESLPALFYQICTQDPPLAKEVNTTLTEDAGKVLERALAKNPSGRFASCGEFIEAFNLALKKNQTTEKVAARGAEKSVAAVYGTASATRQSAPPSSAAQPSDANDLNHAASVIKNPAKPPSSNAVPPISSSGYDLPPIPNRRRRNEEDIDEDEPRRKRFAIVAAICVAALAAILFFVRWKAAPSIPTQVIDSHSGHTTPPPSINSNTPKKQTVEAPATQAAQTPPAQAPNQNKTPAPVPATEQPKVEQPKNVSPESGNADRTASQQPTIPGGIAAVDLLSEPPRAQMIVDGNPATTCSSPCTLSLSNGRHTLAVQLDGYQTAHRIFNVPDERSLYIPLNRNSGTLVVTSLPSGSSVLIDGKTYGHTPVTLHLAAGSHRLEVVNGSRRHEETIDISNGGFETRSLKWDEQ